jgi:hypothetical protein
VAQAIAMTRCRSSTHGFPAQAAIAAAAIAIAITMACATAPSPASAAAWNNGTVYMYDDPVPPYVGTACVQRTILLKQGNYRWKMYLAVNDAPNLVTDWTNYIKLRAARYLWKDCLGAPTGQYQQCSWLDDLDDGIGGAAVRCVWPPARWGAATYDFGSGLDWNPL